MAALVLTPFLVVGLFWLEYRSQDHINDRRDPHQVFNQGQSRNPTSYPGESVSNAIDRLRHRLYVVDQYQVWRLSLIGALIASLPLAYLLLGRLPTVSEWLITVLLVFLASYATNSWLWAHFFRPSSQLIRRDLFELEQRLQSRKN